MIPLLLSPANTKQSAKLCHLVWIQGGLFSAAKMSTASPPQLCRHPLAWRRHNGMVALWRCRSGALRGREQVGTLTTQGAQFGRTTVGWEIKCCMKESKKRRSRKESEVMPDWKWGKNAPNLKFTFRGWSCSWSFVCGIASFVVRTSPTESKTLSRLESIEIKTGTRQWAFETKTRPRNWKKWLISFLNSSLLLKKNSKCFIFNNALY